MLQPASSLSRNYFLIFCISLTLVQVEAFVFCSADIFGFPNYRDCMGALSAVPTDEVVQFFVEQQLRTGLPEANWVTFVDPRSPGTRREVVQLPKLWNYGRSS